MLCGVNLVIDYVFGGAAVVRNFSVYLSQLLNKNTDIFVTSTSFADLDYMALGVCLLLTLIAMLSMAAFNDGNIVVQVIHIALVVFVMVAGFAKAERANWHPFFPFGSRAILTGAANIFFVFVGYDVIALGAEEAKSPSDIPKGMVGSVFMVTVIYVLMTMSLIMLIPADVLANQPSYEAISGFAYAFSYRGMEWAKYIVALGALVGITTSTGISIYGLSRIFVMFARERIIPPFVGWVSPWTNTPMIATGFCGVAIACLSFFTSFPSLANMTSIGTLGMFWFVGMAHIFRRYCPDMMTAEEAGGRHLELKFRPKRFLPKKLHTAWLLFLMAIITGAPVGFAIFWSLQPDSSKGLWSMAIVWFGATLTLMLTCPIEYIPYKYAVPAYALPWVPAASIWCTIMVVGGFGAGSDDYRRLGIAMCAGCGFYLLYSVHASWWRFNMEESKSIGKPTIDSPAIGIPIKDVDAQ
jgi:APA family basic amino acid/polyamine antiporter